MNRFRRKRFALFFDLMQINNSTTILDVGGLPYDWIELGYQGKVICVSLSRIREGLWGDGNIIYLRQDATALPYPDKAFDVVYSNSLLEHVGRHNQAQVAYEIRRVAKRYWVQAPNRYFPIELHYYALFYHQMPYGLRKLIATYWTSFVRKVLLRKPNYYLSEIDTIYPSRFGELQTLFPEAKIIKEKVLFFTKSYIVVANNPR